MLQILFLFFFRLLFHFVVNFWQNWTEKKNLSKKAKYHLEYWKIVLLPLKIKSVQLAVVAGCWLYFLTFIFTEHSYNSFVLRSVQLIVAIAVNKKTINDSFRILLVTQHNTTHNKPFLHTLCKYYQQILHSTIELKRKREREKRTRARVSIVLYL